MAVPRMRLPRDLPRSLELEDTTILDGALRRRVVDRRQRAPFVERACDEVIDVRAQLDLAPDRVSQTALERGRAIREDGPSIGEHFLQPRGALRDAQEHALERGEEEPCRV